MNAEYPVRLCLYITGTTPNSARAVVAIRDFCDARLVGRYHLEIIDLLEHPERAAEDQILATPTLIQRAPLPEQRFIGDLSRAKPVLLLSLTSGEFFTADVTPCE